ncbi:MAG: SAM-dependent DNA methyltransferase, partial [Candidatus Hydrothermota bacterium]
MNNNLPKWLERQYAVLLESFGSREFRFPEAAKVLEESSQIPENQAKVVLAELRKSGVIKVRKDPTDARKRIYRLVSPQKRIQQALFPEIAGPHKTTLTRGELEALLKRAADLIRTRVDYHYILVLLFYKRICDKWKAEFEQARQEALQDGFSPKEAEIEARQAAYHDFDIPEEFLWDNLRKDLEHLPENLSHAFKAMAERNPELRVIFENVDFLQFTQSYENSEILRQLFELFSSYSLKQTSPDILGDAYEWILRYFAPQKAKEGEILTPREVIRLMVEMLEPKPGESV